MTTFLHIGLHKTATTFLQKVLFPKIKEINFVKHQEIIPFLIKITSEDPTVFSKDEAKVEISQFLTKEKNIISAEALSGNPFNMYSNRLDTALKIKQVFPEAKIIVGIRNQKSIIKSLYNQYVKVGGTKSIKDFIEVENYQHPAIYSYSYNRLYLKSFAYYNYLNTLSDLFGRQNLYIYVYEELIVNPDQFIKGICNYLNVNPPQINFKPVNKGYSDNYFSFLRKLNYLQKSYISEKGFIPRIPKKINNWVSGFFKNDRMYEFNEVFSPYKRMYHQDNEKIDMNFNLELQTKYHDYYE